MWWYSFSYNEPEPINVDQLIAQLKAKRNAVENATTTQALPSDYEVKAGGVYYRESLITDADPTTFQYLGDDYVKDKTHAYWTSIIIQDVDLDTFEYVGGRYAKDKVHVYYPLRNIDVEMSDEDEQGLITSGPRIILGADPATFQYLGAEDYGIPYNKGYAKDKLHAYWGFDIVEGADVLTFQRVSGPANPYGADYNPYFKDRSHVYFYGRVIRNADPETFQYLVNNAEYYITKDKAAVYCVGCDGVEDGDRIISEADPATFQYVGGDYFKDKAHVYDAIGEIVKNADPATCTTDNLDRCEGAAK